MRGYWKFGDICHHSNTFGLALRYLRELVNLYVRVCMINTYPFAFLWVPMIWECPYKFLLISHIDSKHVQKHRSEAILWEERP
jgi:hypothetical protein